VAANQPLHTRAKPAALATALAALALLATPAVHGQLATSATHAQPPGGLRARAAEAFAELHRAAPRAEATWDADKPGAALVTGLHVATPPGTPRQRAQAFLASHADLLGVPASELRFLELKTTRNRTVARFSQLCPVGLGALPVYNRFVTVAMDPGGTVLTLSSDVLPVTPFQRGTLSAERARDAAVRGVFGTRPEAPTPQAQASQAHETVVAMPGRALHAYVVEVVRTPLADHRLVLVDARDGTLLEQHNTVLH